MNTSKVMVSFQTPVELARQLDQKAAAADRSRSAEIREAIREHLRATETNPKETTR